MNLAKYSITHRAVMWAIIILTILAGGLAYKDLGRLEDPEFTIKEAVITSLYPGASAVEVEEEVTEPIESAVQQLKQLHEVRSISRPGVSIVFAEIKDHYNKDTLPQVWDELRRKVGAAASRLPPGVVATEINDDFGDVYGIFFALTGDGYSPHDLEELAKDMRLELLLCEDVGKVSFMGIQEEVVYVNLNQNKLATLGISPETIFGIIEQQNTVVSGGATRMSSKNLRLEVSGAFTDPESIEQLLIPGSSTEELIRLEDLASVERGYWDPPTQLLYFNGKPAVGIGISTVSGGNVITMGDSVSEKLKDLQNRLPIGVELHAISYQSETVSKAVNGFVLSLIEALAIVLVVLILFMGFREGMIIGTILLLTILGTFVVMEGMGIALQRISLGALIIALGMLVDNAIVIVEGIMIKLQQGKTKMDAAIVTLKETQWPLLGATFIAILAFAAISVSRDETGEYLVSLFQVIAISLGLSWLLAVTVAPFLCDRFLKTDGKKSNTKKDLYDSFLYQIYKKLLQYALVHRWKVTGLIVMLLALAMVGFGFVKQNFFPDSSRPQFTVSLYYPEGTHIAITEDEVLTIGDKLSSFDDISDVSAFIGGGGLRFMLIYSPEMPAAHYGQLLISVSDYKRIPPLIEQIRQYLSQNHPDAVYEIKPFTLGPPYPEIEARIIGPDEKELYRIAEQYMTIMREHDNTESIRSDWGRSVHTLNFEMSETRSRESGVARLDIARSIAMNNQGIQGGIYRDGDDLLPIIMKVHDADRPIIDRVEDIQVWSSAFRKFLPIQQVVNDITMTWSPEVIERKNRKRTLTVSCKQIEGTTASLFNELRPQIEAVALPNGFELEWGGEYESSTEANQMLAANVPMALTLMFLISIALFNSFRIPVIIFIGLPLALIGVTAGLLFSGQPFGFMATLGFLSLSGMLIKNEIVLLEQINIELANGKSQYQAVVDAAVSRMRPVAMAAITTVLGMIPLLWDPFFAAMAVTIMAGLTFATALTLVVVPVLYTLFFRVKQHA